MGKMLGWLAIAAAVILINRLGCLFLVMIVFINARLTIVIRDTKSPMAISHRAFQS